MNVKLYVLDNIELVQQLVSDVNCYNGALEHLEVYENNEEFFNMYFKKNPMEAVRSAFYGDYNYYDDYVRFNGYGNLESFDEYDYFNLLRDNIDEIIMIAVDVLEHLDGSEEFKKLVEYTLNGYI